MTRRRLVVWRGLEEWLAESAEVQLGESRLTAVGTQLGEEPHPYRLDYELRTGDGWVTESLASSPLTNAMPILRDRLVDGGDPQEYLMAWVSVPDLAVTPSPQRYEPIDTGRVRFVSLDSDFRADLRLDEDGLVVRYPRLAERV